MLDTSQISQIQQPQAWSQCQVHPGFDFDTICFHLSCRQKSDQIICSYCSQLEPHSLHVDQQHPIYKTSPGFRSINFTKDWHKLPQIMRQREKIAKDFANLKTYFIEIIDKMTDYSLRKLQCLSKLLTKNAVSKVCHTIRQNHRKHVQCCVKMINDLKMRQEGKPLCKEEAYNTIDYKLRNEYLTISNKIEHIKMTIVNLFEQYDSRVNHQLKTQTNIAIDNIVQNAEYGLRVAQKSQQTSFSIKENNLLPLQPNRPQAPRNHKEQQISGQNSLIDQLTVLASQQSEQQQCDKSLIKYASNNNPPIGIDFEQKGTIVVWNANPKALNYLRCFKDIKNLIIQDSSLCKAKQFQTLIKDLPELQGIHINCKQSIGSNQLMKVKVSYLNFQPSFRFIQITDRSKYFSKVEKEMPDLAPQLYIKRVFKYSKYQKKNKYIYNAYFKNIKDHVTQVNFIQTQQKRNWTIFKRCASLLDNTKNLQILVFNNINLQREVCFNPVYKNNSKLHTVVFDGCKANYRRLIYQFRSLNPKQLKHLQISGNGLEERIALRDQSMQRIFFHQQLETLILTNINFGQCKCKKSEFQSIGKLARLTHLNLYDSWPIQPKILDYLHKNCRKQLRYLNIGCSEIADKQRFYKSPPFSNLQSLCLDYTQINQVQLAIFMKNSVSLKYLSIQNLNGERIESEQTDQGNNKCYGLITPQFFMGLQSKSLKYINIYNCFALSDYCWEGFDDLECIRVNEGFLNQRTIGILKSKGIILNIVKKYQLFCSRVKHVKMSFRQLNEQVKDYQQFYQSKDLDQLEQSEESGIQSFCSDDQAEDDELELISNQGTLQRVTTNKTNILLSKRARKGL